MRQKLATRKQRRAIEQRLRSMKTLGEADEDDNEDDIAAWVARNRGRTKSQPLKEEEEEEEDNQDHRTVNGQTAHESFPHGKVR